MNATNQLNHHASMIHNCTYQITKYPTFLYTANEKSNGEGGGTASSHGGHGRSHFDYPSDQFIPGTIVDRFWEVDFLMPPLLFVLLSLIFIFYRIKTKQLKLLKEKDVELKKLQDAKSDAWKLNADHIYMDSCTDNKLGEGAFGIVLKAKYGR